VIPIGIAPYEVFSQEYNIVIAQIDFKLKKKPIRVYNTRHEGDAGDFGNVGEKRIRGLAIYLVPFAFPPISL